MIGLQTAHMHAHNDPCITAQTQMLLVTYSAVLMQEAEETQRQGQELVKEVWAVVSDYYLDARGTGFSQDKWAALRDKYMTQPFPTHEAAYRCPASLRITRTDILLNANRASTLCASDFTPT